MIFFPLQHEIYLHSIISKKTLVLKSMGAGAPIALKGTLPLYQKNAAIDASHTMHGKIQLIFPLLNGVIVKLAIFF